MIELHATHECTRGPVCESSSARWVPIILTIIALALLLELARVAFPDQPINRSTDQPATDQPINRSTNQPATDQPATETSILVIGQSEPLPVVREGNTLIFSPLYVASLNPETKIADWVVYRTSPDKMGENVLQRNWRTALPEQALEAADYRGGPYDRGHLVPLACFDGSRDAWHCNLMEVVAPQTPALNRGPWLALENRIRMLTKAHGQAVVTCGPLYTDKMPALPNADEPHHVPSHYWLLIIAGGRRECYILPQTSKRDAPPKAFAVDEPTLRGEVHCLP